MEEAANPRRSNFPQHYTLSLALSGWCDDAAPQDFAQHFLVQPLPAERPGALLREAASKPATEMTNFSCVTYMVASCDATRSADSFACKVSPFADVMAGGSRSVFFACVQLPRIPVSLICRCNGFTCPECPDPRFARLHLREDRPHSFPLRSDVVPRHGGYGTRPG